jgi:hypothetical protein
MKQQKRVGRCHFKKKKPAERENFALREKALYQFDVRREGRLLRLPSPVVVPPSLLGDGVFCSPSFLAVEF